MKTETTSNIGKNARARVAAPTTPKSIRRRMPRPHYRSGQPILDPKKCCDTEAYIEPITEEVRSVLYR